MHDALRTILPAVAALGVAALIALFLTVTRKLGEASSPQLRRAVQVTAAAIFFQAAHFSEELLTGFYKRFPALFGLAPMPFRFFVWFNVAWLIIWSLSAWGLAKRRPAALFPLWFLGVASAANGIAHPLLAVPEGGYFPGLATSPLVGVMGVLLLRSLLRLTSGVDDTARAV